MKLLQEALKHKKNKHVFIRLIIFYLVAIVVSNIFRFDLFQLESLYNSLPLWAIIFYSPIQASGVLLGALISIKLLRKNVNTEISFWGTSKKWSIIMSLFPVVLLMILGITSDRTTSSNYYGLIGGLSALIYCVFEEYGWRGYLEEELKHMNELTRNLIIAGLWYVWHLSFLRTPELMPNLILLLALIVGSWGIGKIVKLTKSILAASCFHMVINIILFNGYIRNGLDRTNKIVILAVLIPIWMLILLRWKKEMKEDNNIVNVLGVKCEIGTK